MPECFQVVASIGHQGDWCAAVESSTPPVYVVKVRASFEEQHAVCRAPYRFVKHCRFGSRRDQSNPVAVVAHSPQPLHGLAPEWRVAPHAPVPLLVQTIVKRRVVLCRRFPWPRHRGARVKVEISERTQDLRRRQPLVVLHCRALVSAQAHFFLRSFGVAQPIGRADLRDNAAQSAHLRR